MLGALLGQPAESDGVRALVRLLPRLWPLGAWGLAALVVTQALVAAATMPVVGSLLEGAAALAQGPPGGALGERVVVAFAALVALRVAQQLAAPAAQLVAAALGRRVTRFATGAVLDGSLGTVGTDHLEDPRFANQISLAQGVGAGTYAPSTAVAALAQVATARLSGIAAAVLLGSVLWWAPFPLLLAWRVVGSWLDREMHDTVRRFQDDTPTLRHAAYLRNLGLDGIAAKELRVFGMGPWLAERFSASWWRGMRELARHGHGGRATVLRAALLAGTYAAVLGALGTAVARGSVGIAELAVAVQASLAMASLGWSGDTEWVLTGASAAIPHALALQDRAGQERVARGVAPAAGLPARGIHFQAVTFRYPGRERPALDGLDLWVPAGDSLALVGDNGAGKTTLVKLLARCHEPDRGRILVDGADLAALDPSGWRRQLAVVFQDFLRFELPARDNVAFGRAGEQVGEDDLRAAARMAGAEDLIDHLPHGWDTVLSRRYPGGVDLSGGQWQRLALARAMLAIVRGAPVLVLDEPTAHLDVRAEAALYERLLELATGVTTILISHRFSTVRLASRICVLHDGRVTEQGSHQELLALQGRYARLFGLQAERFVGGHRG